MNEETHRRLDMLEQRLRPAEPLPEIIVYFIRADGTRGGGRRIQIQPLPGARPANVTP